jgi:hypothetical protein
MNIQINDIGHVIQLAIAPVFLLTGVATLLMVLTNRLARIIDRSRVLEDRLDTKHSDRDLTELEVLYRRSTLINVAITLGTITGFLICIVIAMLFTSDTTNVALDKAIAACFVLGMLTLIGSFIYLLREIFIASKSMIAHRRQRPRI